MAWAGPGTFPSTTTFPGFDPAVFTPGPADAHHLVITVNGAPVDISADIVGHVVVEQQRRSTELESPQPGTLTVTLANPAGKYTPDNPGSPYWPYLTLQTPIQYLVTKNGFTASLLVGKIDSIAPTFTQSSKNGTVTLTASDALAEASRQILKSDINERWNALTRAHGGTSDVWMFGEEDGATTWRNTGYNSGGHPATRIPAKSGKGQAARDDAEGLIVEGAVTVTDSVGVGPVILARHAPGQVSMMIWFKFEGPPPYLPDYDMLMAGRVGALDGDGDGQFLWSIRYAESSVGSGIFQLQVRDGDNNVVGILDTGVGDGVWHPLFLWNFGSGSTGFFYDHSAVILTAPFDLVDQEYITLGGQMNPYLKGSQLRCMTASFAALMVTSVTVGGLEPYVQTGSTSSATGRWADLMDWRSYGGTFAIDGTDAHQVAVKSSMGRAQLDCINELALTIGGTVWHNPIANQVELITGPKWRPQVPAAAVTLWLDDDIGAGHEWGLSLADSPTRATAMCPDGDAEFIDVAAEAGGIRDAGQFETCAATVGDARSLAAWATSRVKRLSLSRFGVDVASAVNAASLWGALLTLRPGARLHVIGVDQGVFGVSSFDVHVLAWSVEIGPETALWTFDCLPADSPPEWTVGDAWYGRVGWNDGEATSSTLGPATATLTIAAPDYPLTTDPGEYPMSLLVDLEVMTVAAPPASSVSPQTVFVTRGAMGTVPVAHPAGRSVHIAADVVVGP